MEYAMKPCDLSSRLTIHMGGYASTFCDLRPAERSSLPPVSKARPIGVSVADISQMGRGGELEFEDFDGVDDQYIHCKRIEYIVLPYNNTQMQTRYVSVIALLCSSSVYA